MFQTTFVEGDTGILFVGSGVVTADEIRSSKLQLFANVIDCSKSSSRSSISKSPRAWFLTPTICGASLS